MGALQVLRRDRAPLGAQGGAQLPRLDAIGQLLEDLPLAGQVRGAIAGAGEHELPVEAGAFALEPVQIQRRPVADDRDDRPLGPDQLRHDVPVGVGIGEVGDSIHRLQAQLGQLGRQLTAVVEDMIGAQLPHPGGTLRPGGGGDHQQAGAAGQLDRQGADAAGAADDQQ